MYREKYKKYQTIEGWNNSTIADAMCEWCEKYRESICIISNGEKNTYAEIGRLISETAAGLMNMGIQREDRVILQLPNSINYILCFFGLLKIGAIPIMALPAHRINEIKGMIHTAKPTGYICQERYMGFEYAQIISELKEDNQIQHILQINSEKLVTDSLDIIKRKEFPYVENLDIAFLSLSGGTTGMSKLIPRTHGDYLYDTEMSVRRCELQKTDIVLVILPLAHNFIIGHPGFLGTFSKGATLLLSTYPDINEGLELIEEYKATFISMVPSMAKLMLEMLKEDVYDISSLRVVQIGGAFLEEAIAQELIDLDVFTLQQVFGVAEGLNTMTALSDSKEIIKMFQGKPISPYDEIRIADENGNPLKNGEYGELLIRGPYTIHSYYNNPENEKFFTEDGFYKTGDRAYLSEGGNLKISGRITELINKSGEKIIPSEIETYLISMDSIKDCAVVGLPDENQGEMISVFIVSDNDITLSEVRNYLTEKELALFKLPDCVFMIDMLPLTKIGKTDKKGLIEIGKERLSHGKE
ncbi:AMP-binding protein [Faecalicatena contorta]|uniref:Yersiniabactin salicyl-AMP ligase n=1 Tax=Faecalicatena contorta TaxID=39482 RepID=A0A315ZVZ8_9FIRM|nr:AMP-binding protein [Faecalicatena contorta]PWJ49403.1 yersiniabactin salicyl-AMP ligase [Faecalicatena contorta]SUQ14647.1 yersiniabactin salicyl-AMP ligase [Faecalicatena contorta]